MNKKQKLRCEDCPCLIEGSNGDWICDELEKPCRDIDVCPEWTKEGDDFLDKILKNGGTMKEKDIMTKIFDFVADSALHNTPVDIASNDFNTRHYSIGKANGRIEAFLEVMKFINKLREEQGD